MTAEILEDEVVDGAITVIEPHDIQPVRLSSLTPVQTIDLATQMADALKDIVTKQKLYTVIQNKMYPHVEAWMTIGRMDNVVAQEAGSPVPLEGGGFEATVELLRLSDGAIVGRGSAWAGTTGDRPWDTRPAPVQRSMAVTRATSRAFRQQYGWIMALAGYEPTPAEEMPDDGSQPARNAPERPPAPRAVPAATSTPASAPESSDEVLEAGVIQAVVSEDPEAGVRMVQSAHDPKQWEGAVAKLEVITKVGNRKHTGILLREVAEAAAEAGIKTGDVVRFTNAHVEEITWQEGKPTKKEIWGTPLRPLGIEVMRDGTWTKLGGPSSAPASSTAPSTAPSATTTSPAPSEPTRRRGPDGQVETTLRVKLLEPLAFKVHPRTNEAVASLKGVDPETGEVVYAALGGDENVEADLGTPAAPEYGEGDIVQLVGTWQGGWLVLTTVGKPA